MDKNAVRKIVDEVLPTMASALWVRDWEIETLFGPTINTDWAASCERNAPYMRATITIDPEKHGDEDSVLNDLRHELLHLVVGEFDIYMNMVRTNMSEEMENVEKSAWVISCERTVARMERMLDGLGLTPRVLAGKEEDGRCLKEAA